MNKYDEEIWTKCKGYFHQKIKTMKQHRVEMNTLFWFVFIRCTPVVIQGLVARIEFINPALLLILHFVCLPNYQIEMLLVTHAAIHNTMSFLRLSGAIKPNSHKTRIYLNIEKEKYKT